MKKTILLAVLLLPLLTIAQAPRTLRGHAPDRQMMEEKKNRLSSLSIAYLTRELALTPAEAEKFWPVYNRYTEEVKQSVRDQKTTDLLDKQQRVLDIRKKYRQEFNKILTQERTQKVFQAEMKFRSMVKKEWEKRNTPRFKRPQQPPTPGR